MAKLTAKKRNALPSGDFAVPGRRYPINDPNHARNALARVSQYGSPTEKAEVRGAVARRYPGIGDSGEEAAEGQNDNPAEDRAEKRPVKAAVPAAARVAALQRRMGR